MKTDFAPRGACIRIVPTPEPVPVPAYLLNEPPHPPKTMREVTRFIAWKHQVTIEELHGCSRKKCLVKARKEEAAMCRALKKSLPQIGRHMGGRDHTSIHYYLYGKACRRQQVAS